MFLGRMTWRELDSIISRLPMESAYRTEVRDQYTDEELVELHKQNDDPKHGRWSRLELLISTLIFDTRRLIYTDQVVGGWKEAPLPEPVKTPGSGASFRKARDPRAVAYLQRIRDQHDQGA